LVGFISGVFLTPLIALITTPLALLMFETIRLKEIKTAMVSVREWLFSVGWIFVIRFGIGILMISAWGIAILIVN
jgi:phosphatidylserine synthase